jgi:4-amino-4-deoxychorismate lyase
MYQLLESIRIENRELQNLRFHNQRFNEARKMLFGKTDQVKLEELVRLPEKLGNERYKCRALTNGEGFSFDIALYHQREIKTLKIVIYDEIDYTYKTTDRSVLDHVYSLRGNCDDVIIVKNGMMTDSWAANLLFFDGSRWLTPSTPLLKGTQRQFLLSKGIISEALIRLGDIGTFKKVKLINAMIDFERAPEIDVASGIVF